MTLGRLAALPALVLATLLSATLPAFPASADLQGDILRALTATELKGATISISVRDPDTDRVLARVNDRAPMIPASNMKLLTTGAALHILGGDFSFETRLLRDGDRLIVVGDGDPAFGDPELLPLMTIDGRQGITCEEFVALWVDRITEHTDAPIAEIVVDDRVFDREFIHPTWPRDQLVQRYCAEVAGLTFHLNVLHFYPQPLRGQRPDVSRFEPRAPWIDTTGNRATSQDGPQVSNTFSIARPADANDFTFYGNVKETYREPVPVTLHDMPSFFASLLADRLNEAGVAVASSRVVDPADPPSKGEPAAPVVRTPIATIVLRCNRDSQNLYAESLLKRAGHAITNNTQPGSFANGAAALRLAVEERLDDTALMDELFVADGSGLSRDNRVSASLLTAWLDTFHRDPTLGPILIDSLAVGGMSGTLKTRFTDAAYSGVIVQAKSGYINEVSCLSGFVSTPDGRRRSFSVLVNDLRAGTVGNAKLLQEAVVAAIAKELLALRPVEIGG